VGKTRALFLSPGLRVAAGGRWAAFVSVGIPVVQRLHGKQDETGLRVTLGAGMGF